ncbi:sensor histidine kinase [Deinococcus lacus]|uniref:histidine kinase n=1 Tax=Deinococcus lacus TaxID=392561 RepID=A0ABW1Y9Q7_9DEIO
MSAAFPPGGPAAKSGPRRHVSLRAQMTTIIALLAFLPNCVVTAVAGPRLPLAALLVWLGIVVLLSGMMGYVLSGVLLRPLSRLEQEVAGGEFGRSHRDDPAEIVSLRRAFVGLLDRLSTEQARRNAFMATLVHDLKTPLIATGHLVHTLTHYPLSESEKADISTSLLAENARLLALVGQMADAHRFERENVTIQKTPTDLRSLLSRVAASVQSQAAARGLKLSVAGEGQVMADTGVLERAVTNLASNAIRYAESCVTLRVTEQGVQVLDDGPGLSRPLSELAQPFNAQPTTIAGEQYTAGTAGLGLFIVRRIAEAHGGWLGYQRAEGGPRAQTVFQITLPEVEQALASEETPAQECA